MDWVNHSYKAALAAYNTTGILWMITATIANSLHTLSSVHHMCCNSLPARCAHPRNSSYGPMKMA